MYICNSCSKTLKSIFGLGWRSCPCDHDYCTGYICSKECAFHRKWDSMPKCD